MNKLVPKYKVKLIKKGKSHLYQVDDTVRSHQYLFKSVTGYLGIINKPLLIPWAKKVTLQKIEAALNEKLKGRKTATVRISEQWIQDLIADAKKRSDTIRDDAANFGTKVHDYIELTVKGEALPEIPLDLQAPTKSFQEWWGNSGIKIVKSECDVASIKWGFGGRLDAIGMKNDQYILLDWKTSSGIYPEHALQCGGYAIAAEEMFGISIDKAIVVRFGKKLPIEYNNKELADLRKSCEGFLLAKQLKENLSKDHFCTW